LKKKPVRFGFISLKLKNKKKRAKQEKTEAKPSQTGFCPKKPNRTEISRFEPVLIFKKKINFVNFFNKN